MLTEPGSGTHPKCSREQTGSLGAPPQCTGGWTQQSVWQTAASAKEKQALRVVPFQQCGEGESQCEGDAVQRLDQRCVCHGTWDQEEEHPH